jgi:hypothetical protein
MAQRRQRGWIKKESRIPGETWVLHFRTTRKSESNALRPLPDNHRLRSHDHYSRTSLRNRPQPARARAYSDAFGCGHGSSHLRVPGTAMARCRFCGGNDSCTSHVDVWSSGFAKDQSFKGPCAAPSIAGRIHASLEREDRLFGAGRLGVCFLSTERQAAAGREYARRRLSAACRSEGWNSSSHRDDCGRLVEDDPRRFGFHNLRHSLASFLVRIRTDPKTVQTLLRHSDVRLTHQFYSHAVSQDRMAAAGEMLIAILSHAAGQSGLGAD